MNRGISLGPKAEADLRDIYDYVSEQASPERARIFLDRIIEFLGRLDLFPERGTIRDDVRPGLRIIGFERRVSIAFIVEEKRVVILRILYAGRRFEPLD